VLYKIHVLLIVIVILVIIMDCNWCLFIYLCTIWVRRFMFWLAFRTQIFILQ